MSDLLQVKFKNSAYDSSVSSLFELKAKAPADDSAFLQAFRHHYDHEPKQPVVKHEENHRPDLDARRTEQQDGSRQVDDDHLRAEQRQREDEEARQQVKRRDEKHRRETSEQEEPDAEAAAEQTENDSTENTQKEAADNGNTDESEVKDEEAKADAEDEQRVNDDTVAVKDTSAEKVSLEKPGQAQNNDKPAAEVEVEDTLKAEVEKETEANPPASQQVKVAKDGKAATAAKAEKDLETDQNTVKEKTITNTNAAAKQAAGKKQATPSRHSQTNRSDVDELSRQTGVRVHNFNVSNNGNKSVTEDSNTRAQLLKRLDSKVPTNLKRAMDAVDQQLQEAADGSVKPSLSSSKVAKQVVQVAGKALTNGGMQGSKVMVSPEISPARAAEGNQFQRVMQMQANSNLTQVRLVNVIQDIMSRMQGLLGGKEANSSQVSVDFETSGLGRMQLTLQERAGGVEIALQTSTDSTRDQLMNQRDELAQQIREMGFKDVSLDIHSKNDQRDHNRQQARGNEDAENVKLAGNDHTDMKQATTGVTG